MPEPFSPPRRFAGIERKVNRFFVVASAGIVGVLLLVGYKQGLFVSHTPLYFHTADAIGIGKGTTVKLLGLQVGAVKNMALADHRVKVEMAIANEYLPRIPKGSHIKLAREGYVGGASLQIIPRTGSGPAQPVTAGDEMEFVTSHTIVETIDDIKNQVAPLVSDVRGMLADFNRPDGDYRKSFAATRELLEQLQAATQEARRLLRDTDRTAHAAEAAFGSVARVGAQAEQELPVVAGKLASTLDTFAEVAAQVRETTRKNGEALHETLQQTPALVRQGTDLVREGRELVRDGRGFVREGSELVRDGREIVGAVRNTWPIRTLVEAPGTRTLPLDSAEAAVAARDYPVAPAPR